MPPLFVDLLSRPRSAGILKVRPIFAIAVAVAFTVVIYWPGLDGGFLLDDYPNIVNNPALHNGTLTLPSLAEAVFSSGAGLFDRPLSMLSFALNAYVSGVDPYWMKLTNLVIHCLNGLLVYWVVSLILTAYRRQCRTELSDTSLHWTATAIATAWLLLPINLTAVLYVVQRMTSLSATFVLVGLGLYLRGRMNMLAGRPGLWLLWFSIIVFGGLAVLAKEAGALLPVYALVIEWTLFGCKRADGHRDPRVYVLFALTLVLPGILGLVIVAPSQVGTAAYANRTFSLGQRLLTEPRVVMDYVAWILLPRLDVLSLYHDDYAVSRGLLSPPTTLFAIVALTALAATAVWQRKRRPLLSLGILWFLGGQLLTATIFNLELVYEHRNYLPSLGLLLVVFPALLFERSGSPFRLPRRAGAVGLILLYAVIVHLRAEQWSNPLRHAVIAAAEHPASPRATYALGRLYASLALSVSSRYAEPAVEALERAAAAPHADILPEQGLLLLNARLHRPLNPAWWNGIERKLRAGPISAQGVGGLYTLVNCSLEKSCVFPTDRMQRILTIARRRNPENANLDSITANYTLNILGDTSTARQLMLRATKLVPRQPQYWVNLIKLDVFLHRFDDAHVEIDTLESLNRLGRLDETIANMRQRLHQAEEAYQPSPEQPPQPTLRAPTAK